MTRSRYGRHTERISSNYVHNISESLCSLIEELKVKLLDFSDRFDQSEDKLLQVSEIKKAEVTEQINKMIEHIRQLEEEFHSEIEEFKNNRLS